ncbi:MAG: RcnB family protein [Perlucidibaca sp.]
MKTLNKLATVAITLSLALSSVAQAHERDSRDNHHSQSQQDRGSQHGKSSQARHWKVGQQVPKHYRGQHYIVQNWKQHRLHQPPRGYQWVSVNNDYLLVSVVSGVVLQAILGH